MFGAFSQLRHRQSDAGFGCLKAAGLHQLEFRIFLYLQGYNVRLALFRDHAVEAKLQSDYRDRTVRDGFERLRVCYRRDIVLERQLGRLEVI